MKVVVVYDSVYGNTEKVAQAIVAAMADAASVVAVNAAKATAEHLVGAELVVVGAPTQGGRPTPEARGFLDRLPEGSLAGVRVATFDTRMEIFVARVFGYAATRIRDTLRAKGARVVADPEGFIVKDRDGPLKAGELERAAVWAGAVLRASARP